MIDTLLAKVFGTKAERELKRIRPMVAAINNLEGQIQQFSDEQLAAKTAEFRQRIAQGAKLDDVLIEAFAVCREAGKRTLNMRHFDVQLIGGIVLHEGKIAEMRTGEGKTLVATLPVYLNALEGKGVHVVTTNDYLARRDSDWMGRIYKFLGLSVGNIIHGLDDFERKQSYLCDITYGTNNEYGFDYLRDNMKFRMDQCVQRGHNFAIVDEVDSILIDEARTPLIISGPSEESTDKYYRINQIIPKLVRGEVIEGNEPGKRYTTGDYTIDEKSKSVALTEEGVLKCERLLGVGNLYDPENIEINHHVQQGLRAHVLYRRDQEYVIENGQVVIVDEFTGRKMPGRRWSDGLHQAVEAKEGVKIERETQTLATVTFQNYFRMYNKLAGMTGTAETEAAEFAKTYKVDVMPIPTNRKMQRIEHEDIVFRTEEEKFRNAAKEVKTFHDKGQPVLVGTVSIEKSEKISKILTKMGVKHEVLNAKNHEREASIVAQAGRKGAVTVSTNMAGRGTDILLGGNPEFLAKEWFRKQSIDPDPLQIAAAGSEDRQKWDEVLAKYKAETQAEHDEVVRIGGLHIVGTERHESRRIDNQLRGRSGRQGDPGSARFYLSLQDDLMRVFGGERIQNLMLRLGMEEDVPIESKLITKRIAAAQKAVEAQHFAARKHLLEYDDVMNKQRTAVYDLRRSLIEGGEMKDKILEYVGGIVGTFLNERIPPEARSDQWDLNGLENDVLNQFGVRIPVQSYSGHTRAEIERGILKLLEERYAEKEALVGAPIMRETERIVMLNVIDAQWKDHLLSMDHLKEGIGLRGYGQKDPLVEYKKESFLLFEAMMDRIEDDTVRYLYFLQAADEPPELGHDPFAVEPEMELVSEAHGSVANGANAVAVQEAPPVEKPLDEADISGALAARRKAAQNSLEDFARSIQRKKDREMDQISMVGTESTLAQQPKLNNKKDVGRNDLCPCGSGKKYKKCHGA